MDINYGDSEASPAFPKCSCAMITIIMLVLLIQLAMILTGGVVMVKDRTIPNLESNLKDMVDKMNIMADAILKVKQKNLEKFH